MWRNILAFYATVGVPLFYVAGLWFITQADTVLFVPLMRIIGLLLSVMGMMIWMGSYVSLGKNFGVLPRSNEKTRKGLYQYLKHPMYIGIMLTYLGLSTANQSQAGIVYTVFGLGPLLWIRAKLEEKKLKNPDTISLEKR